MTSYDASELIEEIKEDIDLYGKDYKCYVYYKKLHGYKVCTDYALEEDLENKVFNSEEGEFRVETTLIKALKIFKKENITL